MMPTIIWLVGLTVSTVGLYYLVGTAATVFCLGVSALYVSLGIHCAVVVAVVTLLTGAVIFTAPALPDLSVVIIVLLAIFVFTHKKSKKVKPKDKED